MVEPVTLLRIRKILGSNIGPDRAVLTGVMVLLSPVSHII
jgi:hypothetical protein